MMIIGSVLRATHSPYISTFQDGWRGVVTLVPSVRIILFGSTIKSGMVAPIIVRMRKAICEQPGGLQSVFPSELPKTYVGSVSD